MTRSQLAYYAVAQLVEYCTDITEVMGLNPSKDEIFFLLPTLVAFTTPYCNGCPHNTIHLSNPS